MNCPEGPIQPPPSPAEKGNFTWQGLLLAIVAAPLFGLVWAWVAEVAQFYVAPIILFPVVLGALAGLSIVGLVRFAQIGHRPTIVLAAVLAAAVAGTAQHYFGYLAAYAWTGRAAQDGYGNRAGPVGVGPGTSNQPSASTSKPRPDAAGRWWATTWPKAGWPG